MASTYTNDLRLELIATGEAAATWGDKTNVNLTNIAAAFGYATQDGFAANADSTTTVADGAADPARAMYFKVTSSATLTATRTLTIAPNTISRVMWIENATTGGQSIQISQGTGANVTIATGKTAVVYLDGAGSGAAVVDAMAGVSSGASDTLAEILASGNATGGTDIAVGTGDDITFADSSKAIFGAGSDLQIYHDGNHSYIEDAGTGSIKIKVGDFRVENASGNNLIKGVGDVATLHHAGSEKLATAASGIQVSGTVTADGLTVSNSSLQVKLEEADGTNNPRLVTYFDSSGTHLQHTWSSAASNLIFEVGGSEGSGTERMRIDSSGNVGIGNTSPATALDVTGTVTTDGLTSAGDVAITGGSSGSTVLTLTTNALADTPLMLFQRTGGAIAGKLAYEDGNTAMAFGTTTAHELKFLTGNTERMQITSSGYIHMTGASDVRLTLGSQGTAGNNDANWVRGNGTSLSYNAASANHIWETGGAEKMRIDASGHLLLGTGGSYGTLGTLVVQQTADSKGIAIVDSAAQNTMFIENQGDEIKFRANSNSPMTFSYSTGEKMRIDSSGNVGIGVGNPDAYGKFVVRGAGNLLNLDATSGVAYQAFFENGAGRFYLGTLNGSDGLAFIDADGSTERMRIDASGNVGIGSTSPSSTFRASINGDGSSIIGGVEFRNAASGGSTFTIGHASATSPSATLNVVDSANFIIKTSNTERMRIDASGNLLVGKTSLAIANEGIVFEKGGAAEFTTDAARVMRLNRTSDDGSILELNQDGTTVGSLGAVSDDAYIVTGDTGIRFNDGNDGIWPVTALGATRDNAIDLGNSGARWDDIYATNGTIQTSDRNEKQDIEALSDAEQRVAVAAKGLLRKFRWKSSVAEKGDDARTHFGIIAQDLQAAFEAEGLDAGDYAMFINSTWTDEETGEERSRMGVRYSELLAFIIAAI